ncbi:MAG: hypothetical protein Q9217_007015 [Psora testacea]
MAGKVLLNGIALITGAASGIGKETAFSFAEAGARGIIFADIDEDGARAAAEESKKFAADINFKAIAVKVDVREEASVDSMVQTATKEFGRIDYNVNSAGIGNLSCAPTPHVKPDIFSMTLDVNARGTMLCVRAVSKVMATQEEKAFHSRRFGERSLGRGSIVNLGSVNSHAGAPGMMSYVASKHAIIGITKTAGELVLNFLRLFARLSKSSDANAAMSRSSGSSKFAYSCQLCMPVLGPYTHDGGKPEASSAARRSH